MILCVDMDAFFASVEQARKPELKGKPVAVIGARERTVVTTASYEARKYGVKTGMSKYEAKRLCPKLILVEANSKIYTTISKKIFNFLKNITYDVEMYSVDEAFIDISQVKDSPFAIAIKIKNYIKNSFDITCSIGVGKNKLIAKMASGVNKPDGYCFVPPEKSMEFIDRFQLKELWGVGRRLTNHFANLGIFTPEDLRNYGLEKLTKKYGKNGSKLYAMAHGEYLGKLEVEEKPVKSIGHSMTLPEDIYSKKQATPYLLQLSEMVSARARKHKLAGKTITLIIRNSEMKTFSIRHTLPFYTSATHHIFETVKLLINDFDTFQGIRLLGISLSNIQHNAVLLTHIFDNPKRENIYSAMDKITEKFGNFAISYASILKCKRKGVKTISPAWKPEGQRNITFQ